jgi:hypothetical protein
MTKLLPSLAAVAALAAAGTAGATAPPVGPLPAGPTSTVRSVPGGFFTVRLPKPSVAGGSWRIARPFAARVVEQASERTTADGGVAVGFRAVGTGSTRIVFALTKGETAHAYASRTFRVVVGRGTCPRNLLQLPANPISPAVAAALRGDPPSNRPQVVSAAIAPHDAARGPQVRAQCGATVAARTVVVSIVDRALLPAQSAASRVLFVGRTADGYRVWSRAH